MDSLIVSNNESVIFIKWFSEILMLYLLLLGSYRCSYASGHLYEYIGIYIYIYIYISGGECCIAMTNYTKTCICMQNHNNDTIRQVTQFFRKIYLSLYWKGCVWEGVGDGTELQHIDPHSIGHNRVSFLFSWAAQPGAWGPSLSGCWFSLLHLISNSSDPQLIEFPVHWVI